MKTYKYSFRKGKGYNIWATKTSHTKKRGNTSSKRGGLADAIISATTKSIARSLSVPKGKRK